MQLILRLHIDLSESIHKNACLRVLSQFEILPWLVLTQEGRGRAHRLSDRGVRGGLLVVRGLRGEVEVRLGLAILRAH